MAISFVLQDSHIYYLIYLDKCYVNVNTFEKRENRFYEMENENVYKLVNYFEDIAYTKRYSRKILDLKVSLLTFNVSKEAKEKLGERFCTHFIRDYDLHFLYQDIYAKHFILNWNAIEKKEKNFIIQPKLFPFYISYLDVMIDENYDIYHKNQRITPKEVNELEKEYKKTLIPIIKNKNKIYNALMNDLKKKYYKTKSFIKNMNLWDYNLMGHIEFFNIAGDVIFEDWILFENFDLSPCSLKIYELDIEVNHILWRLIDAYGLRIVTAKLDVWSEVKTDLQKSFRI
ncbi:hypothetical protein [Nautilia lithotrophica]